ncbi:hypothetical protein RhiirC2_783551 [Rhizophagus irregularis]|uniref:Uncharacterized protein n=1 Tax=Rhizophagus irregularis TaxID=588596 RepID=A0A2N1N0K1_9GLOM|nr:hypothetical protein RhiirC2_783551 [Rhizophagus irregularis]
MLIYHINNKIRVKDVIVLAILKKYITEAIYNSLTFLRSINELYERENTELSMCFDIELSTLVNAILENNSSGNIENINCEIGHYILSLILEGDGYMWVCHINPPAYLK